jgi:glucodextranase-like protein
VIAAVALGAFVVLAGTGILAVTFGAAGNSLGSLAGRVFPSPPSPSPTPAAALRAPRLLAPEAPLAQTAAADVRGMLPDGVRGMRGVRIRIYVNDRKAKEQAVGQRTAFAVRGVPLVNGENEIRASLVGPSGESDLSNVIDMVYDIIPPAVAISDPLDGGVVNAGSVTVRGTTEPGSTVSITNATNHKSATGAVTNGRFTITVALAEGQNALTITAVDRGENRTQRQLKVVKGEGVLKVALSLSRTLLYRARLPETLKASVSVLDPDARPIDGARVTFSISPPGLPTSTFETTTVEGSASWTITVPREGVMAGKGFATVLVVLPDGRLVRDTVRFSFL